MFNVLHMFESAAKFGKARIIFGCGIGPFHTKELEDVTARVIKLTTAGFLRDKESLEYAQKMYPETNLAYACDPAVGYIFRWKKSYLKRNAAPKKKWGYWSLCCGQILQSLALRLIQAVCYKTTEIVLIKSRNG